MLLSKAMFTQIITYPEVCEFLHLLELMVICGTGSMIIPNIWYE